MKHVSLANSTHVHRKKKFRKEMSLVVRVYIDAIRREVFWLIRSCNDAYSFKQAEDQCKIK